MGLRRRQASETLNAISGPGGLVVNRRLKPFLVSPCHVCAIQCVDIMLQVIVYTTSCRTKNMVVVDYLSFLEEGGIYFRVVVHNTTEKCVSHYPPHQGEGGNTR